MGNSLILAGGCFWCLEAVYQKVKGVTKVTSGYIGGLTDNPTYKDICTGTTGHAEVVKIEYDDSIDDDLLLKIFWSIHDPTTLNRQGNDVGTQYRSGVFYQNDTQKELAEYHIQELTKLNAFSDPIVTEVTKASTFYPAEDYHKNYYLNNPNQGYCSFVVKPKVDKFMLNFSEILEA